MNQDFREFIALLNAHEVEYLIVGGYAVAFHGYPRYTKDLDIWIKSSELNAVKMISVLKEFGFESLSLRFEDFTIPGQTIQLGYPPARIDIVTSIDGVEFQNAFLNKVIIEDSGLMINYIDLENLKRNKRASGRKQDLADLENL